MAIGNETEVAVADAELRSRGDAESAWNVPRSKPRWSRFRAQEEKLTAQYAVAINKVLTARQRTMFKKMLGLRLIVTKMGGGPVGRARRADRAQATSKNASNSAKAATTAAASDDDDDDDEPKAKAAATAAPAKAKASGHAPGERAFASSAVSRQRRQLIAPGECVRAALESISSG